MTDDTTTAQDPSATMPTPDPALRQFDRFIGSWELKGRTLGADADNVRGTTTFAWLPGGLFVEQRTKIAFVDHRVEGLEVIGYDSETGAFPSTVYASMVGTPLPYRWELDADEVTIKAEAFHATFRGRWSPDGNSFSGGWRSDPGHEDDPGNVAYDVTASRVTSAGRGQDR